jgi:hypothetical protein
MKNKNCCLLYERRFDNSNRFFYAQKKAVTQTIAPNKMFFPANYIQLLVRSFEGQKALNALNLQKKCGSKIV